MSSRAKRVKKKQERDRKAAAARRGSNKRRPVPKTARRAAQQRQPIEARMLRDGKIECKKCLRSLNNPAAGLADLGVSDGTNIAIATCPCGQRLQVKY